jgi:hypothetical protein
MDKPRPCWHVDLKWTSAILLALALAGTLPVAGLYRATSEDSGRKIVAYVMAGLASPDGLDSERGVADLRDKVHRTGSETLDVGGVPVVVTAADVDTLSPRELRLKVFGSFAARFYDLGPKELARTRGADAKKAEADATLLRPFTRGAHDRIATVLLAFVAADLVLAGLVVLFSRRFGRLVSPGVVLVLAGLPGPLLWAVSTQHGGAPAGSRIGAVAGTVLPLLARDFAAGYLTVLAGGALLLAAAAVGKVIWSVRRGRRTTPPAEPVSELRTATA